MGIEQVEGEVGGLGGGEGAFDADFFDFVGGFAKAGGVDDADGETVEVDDFFDGVAGGAGDGGDDGAVLFEEGVEEGGLSGVGEAEDGEAGSVLVEASDLFGFEEPVEEAGGFGDLGEGLGVVKVADFFAEVGGGFDGGEEIEGDFSDGLDLVGEASGAKGVGLVELGLSLGIDGGADAFGLGEVEATVHEGAEGELSGGGEAAPLVETGLNEGLDGGGGAVEGEFDGFVAGVAVVLGEGEGEAVVSVGEFSVEGVAGRDGTGPGGE